MAQLSSTNHDSECQQFLLRISEDDYAACKFKTLATRWSYREIEGEVIDILFRFLRNENCPTFLLASLISLLKSKLLELDLDGTKHAEGGHYNPSAVLELLLNVVKTTFSACAKDLSILSLKPMQQPTHVSVHSVKNGRRKMEDRHSYYEDMNTLFGFTDTSHGQSMFAVFDGHGGVEAADYAASQLIYELKSCTKLMSQPGEALKEAILQVDSNFVSKAEETNKIMKAAEEIRGPKAEQIKSGSTVVAVLIQGVNLAVAWAGDSQVVLCKAGDAIQLMEPHKPERDDEKARIHELGGLVLYMNGWRVNGQLAVSRAIGDADHKPYVSGEADYEEYEMEGDEEFLILACDGLWDMVEPCDAVQCVQTCLQANDRDGAAEKLVQLAKDNNSLDNITVLVVYLDFNKSEA